MKRYVLFVVTLVIAAVFVGCRTTASGAQTLSVDLPYPETTPVDVTLVTTNGQVTVNSADIAGVRGTLTTNVEAWRATSQTTANGIILRQGQAGASVIPDASLIWSLELGRGQPLRLTHTNTNASATMTFDGLSLALLALSADRGTYQLAFPSPNAADGLSLQAALNSGNFSANGLLNAALNDMAITATSGGIDLLFNGTRPLTVSPLISIQTTAGSVRLAIPEGVPATVTFRTTSGRILEIGDQYTRRDGVTFVNGDPDAELRLLIDVITTVGDFRLSGGR